MLKPHHFSYKCPLKISDLEKTKGGHFCAKCSKDIHDLTDCSLDEVVELQRRKGSICGFVRAVSVTSMVGLAACSKSGESTKAESGTPDPETPQEQTVPIQAQPELMGDICIPEKEIPKPLAEPKPGNKPEPGGEQVKADAEDPFKGEPEVIKPGGIEFNGPVLMGVICEPADLIPQDPGNPKPLDPHREGSPG